MKIYWTKKSLTTFRNIHDYILKEFSESAADKFSNKVFGFIELLQSYPQLGSLEVLGKSIYGFQISRQTRVFYRINKDHISLLTFFDSRQNPLRKPK